MVMTPFAKCVSCRIHIFPREKAGEIRLRIEIKAGASFTLSGPICGKCAANANTQTETALETLRAGTQNILAK